MPRRDMDMRSRDMRRPLGRTMEGFRYRRADPMTLLQTTLLMLAASCTLLLVGFSARESRWGPALMMLGIVGSLLIIAYNIYEQLPAR